MAQKFQSRLWTAHNMQTAGADMCMRLRAKMSAKVQMCKIMIMYTCKCVLRKNVCDVRAGADKFT